MRLYLEEESHANENNSLPGTPLHARFGVLDGLSFLVFVYEYYVNDSRSALDLCHTKYRFCNEEQPLSFEGTFLTVSSATKFKLKAYNYYEPGINVGTELHAPPTAFPRPPHAR